MNQPTPESKIKTNLSGYYHAFYDELTPESKEEDNWSDIIIKEFRKEKLKAISQAKEEIKKEVQKLIADEILVCHQTGEKTSRLTSLSNKIK